MNRLLINILIVFLIQFALDSEISAQEWGVVSDAEWELQPPISYPDAGAVVIFDIGVATTEFNGLEYHRHTRIKIFDLSDFDKIRDVSITHFEYDNLHKLKAQILRHDGTVFELRKNKIRTIERGAIRIVQFSFEGIIAGDIIEYKYDIDYYGGMDKLGPETVFLFSQVRFGTIEHALGSTHVDRSMKKHTSNIPTWYFDHPIFCMLSSFTAKLGADLDYHYSTVNIPEKYKVPIMERVKFIGATAYKKHTWKIENIPPNLELVTSSDLFGEIHRPGIHFQLFSIRGQNRVISGNYADMHFQYIGRSMQTYIKKYTKVTRSMRKFVSKLVDGVSEDKEKLDSIYWYVSNNYEIDSSGYVLRPQQSSLKKLYKKKIGAPFEINLLLVKLLKIVGIESWPILTNTRNKLDFRLSGKFNHMIVMANIGGNNLFLDATAKGCSPGFLPPLLLTNKGVLIDYDNSKPISVEVEECTNSN